MTDEQKEINRGFNAKYRSNCWEKIRAYEVGRRAKRKQKREASPEYQERRKGIEERKAAVVASKQRTLEKQRARPGIKLKKDLRLLDRVIRGIRYNLESPEKNRKSSLKHWQEVGTFRRRKKLLEARYRRARARSHRELERAARRAFSRKVVVRRSAEEKKLCRSLRRRFEKALKAHRGSSVVFEMTGISLPGLRKHLESLFQPGMTWGNYGFYGWHIDHKKPCASFELYIPEQQRRCFHYTNLQPLWAGANLSKGARFVENF